MRYEFTWPQVVLETCRVVEHENRQTRPVKKYYSYMFFLRLPMAWSCSLLKKKVADATVLGSCTDEECCRLGTLCVARAVRHQCSPPH